MHPPPAAVACEAVHLSTTAGVAQAGIASSFLETESVSLLWWFIPWSQHRENVLFFQSQHVSGICMWHMSCSVGSLSVFVPGSEILFSCLIPDGVVCKGGYHASHVLITGFQLFQLHEWLIVLVFYLITWIIPWSSWDWGLTATLDTFAHINRPIMNANTDLLLYKIKCLLYFQL